MRFAHIFLLLIPSTHEGLLSMRTHLAAGLTATATPLQLIHFTDFFFHCLLPLVCLLYTYTADRSACSFLAFCWASISHAPALQPEHQWWCLLQWTRFPVCSWTYHICMTQQPHLSLSKLSHHKKVPPEDQCCPQCTALRAYCVWLMWHPALNCPTSYKNNVCVALLLRQSTPVMPP